MLLIPSLCCTRQAVEGNIMSGVTVPTTIKIDFLQIERVLLQKVLYGFDGQVAGGNALRRRCGARGCPVRSRIHWSVVSTIFSRSWLVRMRGGT